MTEKLDGSPDIKRKSLPTDNESANGAILSVRQDGNITCINLPSNFPFKLANLTK